MLLWSGAARQSRWVQKEWDFAYEQRKIIVPYRLDATPLPDVLANIVYVDSSDRSVGHANLLGAVFGKDFRPLERSQPFPGRWRLKLDPQGFVDRYTGQNFGMFVPSGGYELELRKNGQVAGTFTLGKPGGMFDVIFGGGSNLWDNARANVNGRWTYDADEQVLTLELNANMMGQTTRDVITIVVIEKGATSFRGEGTDGRAWIFERRE